MTTEYVGQDPPVRLASADATGSVAPWIAFLSDLVRRLAPRQGSRNSNEDDPCCAQGQLGFREKSEAVSGS